MFGLPLDDAQLAIYTEEKYGFDNAYSDASLRNIRSKNDQEVDGITVNALEAGIIVDQSFYNGSFEYWDESAHKSIASMLFLNQLQTTS